MLGDRCHGRIDESVIDATGACAFSGWVHVQTTSSFGGCTRGAAPSSNPMSFRKVPQKVIEIQRCEHSTFPIQGYTYWDLESGDDSDLCSTQKAMAQRLNARGFFVLTPTITQYSEDLAGFQALEHFIAGVHKGNDNVQTVLLTADTDTPNAQNPVPGAQMLVTGIHKRNEAWERLLQTSMSDFYASVKLNNLGARVRGGLSDEEGSSAAWHPLIERAAEYGSEVAIIEVARAVDIVARAGSIEQGEDWAAPLFDALADAMLAWTEHPPATPHRRTRQRDSRCGYEPPGPGSLPDPERLRNRTTEFNARI